jgi:hypothetical protein
MTRGPVRPTGAAEVARLAQAANRHPYVAWRDGDGALRVHELNPRAPATIGREDGTVTFPGRREVSREHAEVTMREHTDPPAICVHLLDMGSRHGTEHRTVRLRDGLAVETGAWQPAPRVPARAAQLDAGQHDVRLAGDRYILIGGVPLDEGRTSDRDTLPEPTARQRDVLVELCRPFFEAPDALAAIPTNAEIAGRLERPIGSERVSDLLSQMYRRYGLQGTKEQNRMRLAELARRHLIDPGDYG